ncbi:EscU/YscU/HrcU family type III secretion system export apparatus switch protein [Dyella sp. Tek66A03]|uniref:EscU/YscU/HrcU family type III secretion system export apparatus switch protein n=1 Tax=Dyella sp. Tek66A03 TaxID=3458298 RepID=UPI00403E4414
MKTEKPTRQRLFKESRKGKSFSSRDLIAAVVMLAGLFTLAFGTSLQPVAALYSTIIERKFDLAPAEVVGMALSAFTGGVAPVAIVSIACVALVSLAKSKGVLATEAIRMDFARLNPVNGLRNMFSLNLVKDLVRSVLYALLTGMSALMAWKLLAPQVFMQVHASEAQAVAIWLDVGFRAVIGLLLALAPVYLLAGFVDHRLYIRDLRMDKSEVKQELKDSEGSPEIKQRRRDVGAELSAQVQADVAGSSMILANPTHVAVGIYIHDYGFPVPLVSIREKGARARAVIALAEKLGIPVVRDIRVARAVYARSKRYQFVHSDLVAAVMRILLWLRDIEQAGAALEDGDAQVEFPDVHSSRTD